MNDRKKQILNIVLRTYIEEAEPVGSKYIANLIGLSSATIRNIMSALEEAGYLYQPHTSAGRIPTERAYRDYVNALVEVRNSYLDQIREIRRELVEKYTKYSAMIEKISYALSRMTGYTSFVIYPKDHIYLDGTHFMLEQPEFTNIKKIKKIIAILDEKEELLKKLNRYIEAGKLVIHIGKENNIDGLEDCAVITGAYVTHKNVAGGVGVIGPMRMEYHKVLPVVKYMAEYMSEMVENF
jgi:transcriptional regulator of heat shock response